MPSKLLCVNGIKWGILKVLASSHFSLVRIFFYELGIFGEIIAE